MMGSLFDVAKYCKVHVAARVSSVKSLIGGDFPKASCAAAASPVCWLHHFLVASYFNATCIVVCCTAKELQNHASDIASKGLHNVRLGNFG
jgi:hypothetical protein